MNIYERYNLKRVINASGKMTVLGVSRVSEDVLKDLNEGARNFFEMDALIKETGNYISRMIGCESAMVVSSASAGIVLSVAGLIGNRDSYHINHPYDGKYRKNEIIIPKGHCIDYGTSIELMINLGGGKVIEAGYSNVCTGEHILTKKTENTAAVLYVKSHHTVQKSMLSIEEAIEISHSLEVPVIIDAAAEEDLRVYIEKGADIVIYSGSKAIGGPTSGLIIGKKKYIDMILLQNKGIGRAMKIGKEGVLGLTKAVESYLKKPETDMEIMRRRLLPFIEKIKLLKGFKAAISEDISGRKILRARVEIGKESPITACELVEKMKKGTPSIYTREYEVNKGIIEFDVRDVTETELEEIASIIKKILEQ